MGDLESAPSLAALGPSAQEGCVMLGHTDKDDGPIYLTRYRIERRRLRPAGPAPPFRASCCPFADTDNTDTCRRATWALLSSELVLLTAQLVVLALGVLKELFSLRDGGFSDLHFGLAVVEHVLCLLVILLRLASAWSQLGRLDECALAQEYVMNGGSGARAHSVRQRVIDYIVVGAFATLCVGGSFALLYIYAHLGYSLLVTNPILLLLFAAHCLLLEHIAAAEATLLASLHKAVIYESVLLLKEGLVATAREQRMGAFRRVDRFLSALRHTDMLSMPEHVALVDGFDFESLAMKELLSTV